MLSKIATMDLINSVEKWKLLLKNATNDLMRPLQTRKKINKDFSYLSGEDGTSVAYLAQGGNGCI